MKDLMMKALLAALPALLLIGCEKSLPTDGTATAEDAGNVVLRLSVYEQTPFGTRGVQDLSQLCTRLNIAFFQNDTKVKTVSQKSTDAQWGNVSVSLPEGVYQVVIIGHNSSGSATISSTEKVTFPSNLVGDTFSYCGELTVGATPATYQLQLQRVVAMFRLELTEPLPAQAAKLRFYYTGGSSTFSPAAGYGCVNSRQTVMLTVGEGQQTFEVYTFPHEEHDVLKIVLTVFDAADGELAQHTLEQVPVSRDHITIYTGSLTDGGASSAHGLLLTAEGAWGGISNYTF